MGMCRNIGVIRCFEVDVKKCYNRGSLEKKEMGHFYTKSSVVLLHSRSPPHNIIFKKGISPIIPSIRSSTTYPRAQAIYNNQTTSLPGNPYSYPYLSPKDPIKL